MECRIETYHTLSVLPQVCRACLYWEHPQVFKAQPDINKAMVLKREWVQQHSGGTAGGFVAFDGDVSVGFCHFAAAPFFPMLCEYDGAEASPDSLFIACLHIVPYAQGHGIGRRLRECVEEKAGQDGFPAVETMARMNNADNPSGPISFWQNSGYVILSYHGEFALVRKQLV